MQEPEDLTLKGEESVIDEMERMRSKPQPPMTVADAIERARYLRTQPELIIGEPSAKKLIDVLLSAIEASPCYLKGVRDGIPTFTLLAYDKAAHNALVEWLNSADEHGCSAEKHADAQRILGEWMMRTDLRWPT